MLHVKGVSDARTVKMRRASHDVEASRRPVCGERRASAPCDACCSRGGPNAWTPAAAPRRAGGRCAAQWVAFAGSIHPPSTRSESGMATYRYASRPTSGDAIAFEKGVLQVPDNPVIPYVEGDGTGPDIWRASVRVFDAAIRKAYGDKKKVSWMKVYAGEKSFKQFQDWLPQETVDAMQEFRVSIKGPLTTPVGGGIRSLNVTLRQVLDLYACIRPVRYFEGVGSPMKNPEKLNIVVFRENTEDVYAGI